MKGYEISLERARVDLAVVHGFLRESYWSPRVRRDVLARAIERSDVAGAYETASGAQVGFARLVTDGETFGWLCDVFVLERHRGRGLARALVRALVDRPELAHVRRIALATRDAHGVYRALGFEPVPAERWMERKSRPAVWQDDPPVERWATRTDRAQLEQSASPGRRSLVRGARSCAPRRATDCAASVASRSLGKHRGEACPIRPRPARSWSTSARSRQSPRDASAFRRSPRGARSPRSSVAR